MTTPSSSAGRAAGPSRHDPRSTWLTYEGFYGLTEKPFSLSSDPRFFYHSASHTPAFDELLAGILRRESLSVLTGDIGMGKTTLCRAVIESLDRKTFSAIVPDPFASREDLLKVLLMEFGVMSIDDLTSGRLKGATRTELSYLLYEFLDTLAPLQAFAVVIIDEAQNLSVPLLEEIRILSDSDGRDRQLQVVLVGQLELRAKLMLPEMRQVDQRVSVRSTLDALTPEGVAGYIAHRLQVAGASPDGVWFTDEAIDLIHRQSGGVPRLINRICDRALYEGYLQRSPCIDETLVEAVISGVRPSAPEIPQEIRPAIAPEPELEMPTVVEFAVHVDEDPVEQAEPDEFALNTEDDDRSLQEERVHEDLVREEAVQEEAALEDAVLGAPVLSETLLDEASLDGPFLDPPLLDKPLDARPLHGEPIRRQALRPGPPPALEWSRPGSIVFPREAPQTSSQQFRRRWALIFGVGALCMMGLGGIGAGAVYWQTVSVELAAPTRMPRLPAPPPPPAMPAALPAPVVPAADVQ